MGVLRKSFSHALVLSLVLSSLSVYADGDVPSSPPPRKGSTSTPRRLPTRSTPSTSSTTDKFCAKAPEMLEKLNKENEKKAKELDSLKTQIDEANSYMGIINGVATLKNQYQAGLNKIAKTKSPQSIAAQEADKFKTLDNMKHVIRNGLIINAIGLLFKDSKLDKDDSFKVASLCKKDSESSQPICSIKQSNVVLDVLKGHPLDPILENFRLAYRNIQAKNQDSLKADVQKIINSIPPSITPAAILGMLEQASPGLTSIMASEQSKAELTKCLIQKSNQESLKACEKLLPEVGKKDNFMEQLNKQTNDAVAGIQGFSTIIDESARTNLADLNQEMHTYTSQVQAPTIFMAQAHAKVRQEIAETEKSFAGSALSRRAILDTNNKLMAEQGKDARTIQIGNAESESLRLTGIQTLFYNSNLEQVQPAGQITDQNNAAMSAAIDRAKEWQKSCVDPATINMDYCQDEMNTINSNLNEMKTKYKTKLQSLKNGFAKINTESDNRYKKIETLKKFVAEKYLRMCTQTSNITMKKEQIRFDIAVDRECFSGIHSLGTLEGLGSDVNDIIVKTKFALDITAQKDSTGTFTKEEMSSFSGICQGDDFTSSFSDVCQEIGSEKVVRDKVMDSKEWETFNDKYWVSYDEKSPKGYSVAKKKSNLRVFGEGVLPVVPQMLPMVFGNYMMKQNINMLTNQALYQKQMLHNFDVYNSNPWMYNYNYFGGTGVTTTNTGINNTTGFGF